MNAAEIERKRMRLSRSYQLTTEYIGLHKGYTPKELAPSKFAYAAKLLEYQFLPHYPGMPPFWRKQLRKLAGKRILPDFCVIGPVKSGTSDLAVNILLHPNVMTPVSKEFVLSDPEGWRLYYPTERQQERHAARYGLAMAPFLAPNLHWMELTYRLSQQRPETKIVLTLRDPVKRFYSHWKWEMFIAGSKKAAELPFLSSFPAYVDRALAVFPESPMFTACGFGALQTSIYWKAVAYWIERFGEDKILVLDVADYFSDNNGFLNRIYEFVGLPPFGIPASGVKINENPVVAPPPDEESLARLSEFFRPYNEKLWPLIGKRFDWC